jgi:hypothetical protein
MILVRPMPPDEIGKRTRTDISRFEFFFIQVAFFHLHKKGKVIPVTGRGGPRGVRSRGSHIL